MEKKKAPLPPTKTKGLTRENLDRGQRSNTGGDHYDRFRGRYSKEEPVQQDDDMLFR